MLLKNRKSTTIILPCGVPATVGALVGRHQRILTEPKKKMADKLNELLADILVEIAGINLTEMQPYQKLKFVESMLSADRRFLLTEGRQLSQSRNPVFNYSHEWKDEKGVKQSTEYVINLIDHDNRQEIIDSIKSKYPESFSEIIEKLNQLGSFPTKPYKIQYESYQDVLDNKEIRFDGEGDLVGFEFIFRLFDGQLEKALGKAGSDKISSHSKVTSRLLRFRSKGSEKWEPVTNDILDDLPLDAIDFLRNTIDSYEGEVDTVEIIPNPDPLAAEREIRVDLMGQISFFFPSGRV